jgi:transposase
MSFLMNRGKTTISLDSATEGVMAKALVPDELWQVVEPLLPRRRRKSRRGRPPLSDRAALTGILFVLKTGIPWEYLPQEMGCGSGMTCWRRLRDWHRAGVWKRLHRVLLDRMGRRGCIDFSRGLIDSASVRAVHGGKKRDPAPWTAEKQARNTISSPTPTARRWRPRSPAPTVTTSRNCSRWSIRFRR